MPLFLFLLVLLMLFESFLAALLALFLLPFFLLFQVLLLVDLLEQSQSFRVRNVRHQTNYISNFNPNRVKYLKTLNIS